jgi:hypothetical protein
VNTLAVGLTAPSSTRAGSRALRLALGQVEEVQASGRVARSPDRDVFGPEPDFEGRADPRLLDVAADRGEVVPAEDAVEVQERLPTFE